MYEVELDTRIATRGGHELDATNHKRVLGIESLKPVKRQMNRRNRRAGRQALNEIRYR